MSYEEEIAELHGCCQSRREKRDMLSKFDSEVVVILWMDASDERFVWVVPRAAN